MTLRVWPSAVPLDPDARVLPAPLAATLAGAGAVAPVILLVAGAEARERGWAPRAAVALAEVWSRDGLRIVLADLCIGAPALEDLVGEPNDEGLADVFFYGASLRRVIRGSPGRGFGFIPAGMAPTESREVLTHAGWRQIVAHFFRDGAVLLVYVPSDAPGLDALATRLGAVIALAAAADLQTLQAVLPPDAAVLALIEPPVPTPPVAEPERVPEPEPAPAPGPERALAAEPAAEDALPWRAPTPAPGTDVDAETVVFEPNARAAPPVPAPNREPPLPPRDPRDSLVDALWARRKGAQGGQPRVSPVDLVPGRKVSEEELLAEPPPVAPEPAGRRRGISLILWLALGAAVALGAVFGVQEYLAGELPFVDQWLGRGPAPAAAPANARAAAPGANVAAPVPAPPAALAPVDTVDQAMPDSLPYSVAIAAYPEYAAAVGRAAQLAREQAAVGFFVTPLVHGRAIYYHVMAGPVADSIGAAALMRRLLDAGVKTGSSQWDIVQTRLAFDLGDFSSRGDAVRRGVELAGKNVPTYVVELPLPGAATRWRLYAGAFPGVADANALRPVLRGAGVPDSLVTRIGRPGT